MMIECQDCRRRQRHRGRGLCGACYNRHERHGSLNRFSRRPKRGRLPDAREHGTVKGWWQHQRRGEPYCPECTEAKRAADAEYRQSEDRREYQREYQPRWRRLQAEGRVTIPSVIFDVLETAGISMGLLSLMAWVNELHPEWAETTVKRTLGRLVMEGRVERVEFGDEIRYRMP